MCPVRVRIPEAEDRAGHGRSLPLWRWWASCDGPGREAVDANMPMSWRVPLCCCRRPGPWTGDDPVAAPRSLSQRSCRQGTRRSPKAAAARPGVALAGPRRRSVVDGDEDGRRLPMARAHGCGLAPCHADERPPCRFGTTAQSRARLGRWPCARGMAKAASAPSPTTTAPMSTAGTMPSTKACGLANEPWRAKTAASTATPKTPPSSRMALLAPDAWPSSCGAHRAERHVGHRREEQAHADARDDERQRRARRTRRSASRRGPARPGRWPAGSGPRP